MAEISVGPQEEVKDQLCVVYTPPPNQQICRLALIDAFELFHPETVNDFLGGGETHKEKSIIETWGFRWSSVPSVV